MEQKEDRRYTISRVELLAGVLHMLRGTGGDFKGPYGYEGFWNMVLRSLQSTPFSFTTSDTSRRARVKASSVPDKRINRFSAPGVAPSFRVTLMMAPDLS